MSELIIPAQTMSSIEIAELTGKRHDNVMTDIEKMLEELNINAPDFSGTHIYGKNNKRKIYNLPKRECLILVSGYSIQLRTKIIDRWQELESQAQQPNALNPANMSRLQLLEMAMQAEQERLALEHQLQRMQPDVQALERIAKAEGSLCVTDAAKQLQIQPKKLFGFLFANEWIFKRTGTSAWAGYQDKLRQGLIEHKIEVIQRIDGTDKLVTQVRITAKGMARLAKMLSGQTVQILSVQ